MDRERLRTILRQHLEAGTTSADVLRPVLHAVLGDEAGTAAPSRWELLRALDGLEGEAFEVLRRTLRHELIHRVRDVRACLREGRELPEDLQHDLGRLPPAMTLGWRDASGMVEAVERVLQTNADLALVASRPGVSDALRAAVTRANRDAWAGLAEDVSIASFVPLDPLLAATPDPPLPARLHAFVAERRTAALPADPQRAIAHDERATLAALRAHLLANPPEEERARALDRLLCWPTALAIPHLLDVVRTPAEHDRTLLVLHARLGERWSADLDLWAWLDEERERLEHVGSHLRARLAGHETEALAAWVATQPEPDAALLADLERWVGEGVQPTAVADFLARHEARLSWVDAVALQRDLRVPTAERSERASPREPKVERAPRAPREPFWRPHLRAFFAENWFLVAGILMVVAGASIVAYFTWDEHWLVRYTLIPGLLLGFPFLLARLAAFLEARVAELGNAAALLRGAAILLLPIAVTAVSLLARDPTVPTRGVIVPLMASVYLAVALRALPRWCRAVHPALTWRLGGTLTLFVAALLVRPVIEILAAPGRAAQEVGLASAAYGGFVVLALAFVSFLFRVLDADLVRAARVPRFFAATLALTFLQALAWSHGLTGLWPAPQTYAPLLAGAGALALALERRSLALTARERGHELEAFLGFAGLAFALLLAARDDVLRAVVVGLGGAIWFHHGVQRPTLSLHRWIGATLLALTGVAVGALPSFPREGRPLLGLAWALAFGASALVLRRRRADSMAARVLRGYVSPLLVLTAIVAGITQWQTRSEPLATAGILAVVTAWFALRSLRERSARGLVTTGALAALVLPYLGCVDLSGRTWHGNTMVFGLALLAWLWIAGTALSRAPHVRGARSSVLWIHGALAFFAMLARTALEPLGRSAPDGIHLVATYGGPLLMAGALVVAAHASRSLVPGFVAMGILVVLFPELRVRYQDELERLGWGTGIGSAVSALALTALAFLLKRIPALRALGPGDRWLGTTDFPARRFDARLYTLPITVSVLFLLVRTCTHTYLSNLPRMSLEAAAALGFASATWVAQAIYHASRRAAPLGTHLGALLALLAIHHLLAVLAPHAFTREPFDALVLPGLAFTLGYGLARLPALARRPWCERVLARPLLTMLICFALFHAALQSVLHAGAGLGRAPWFTAFLLAQLAWHAVRTRRWGFAGLLFALGWSFVVGPFGPWHDPLRWTWSPANVQASLVYVACVLGALALLETHRRAARLANAFRLPFVWLATFAFLATTWGTWVALAELRVFPVHVAFAALATGLLAARALGRSSLALLGFVGAHVLFFFATWQHAELDSLRFPFASVRGLAPFALALALASVLGAFLARRAPVWIRSREAPCPSAARWLAGGAWLAALWALVLHAHDVLRELLSGPRKPEFAQEGLDVALGWTIVCTLGAVAARLGRVRLVGFAVLAAHVANLGLLLVLDAGRWIERDLRVVPLLCQSALLTVFELLVVGAWLRDPRWQRHLRRLTVVWLGGIAFLLAGDWLNGPDLARSTTASLFAAAGTWWLVGCAFLALERRPVVGSEFVPEGLRGACAGAWLLASWALCLAPPFVRTPTNAPLAFAAVVGLWFAVHELGGRRWRAASVANAALATGVWLLVHLLPGAYAIWFFPGAPPPADHVYRHAAEALLLGLLWLRLGRDGGAWRSGLGLSLAALGVVFLGLWSSFLHPEVHPLRAAVATLAIAHVGLFLARGAPRLDRWFGARDAACWKRARAGLAVFLAAAAHVAVLAALARREVPSEAFAPLLVGAATVLLHAAWRHGSGAGFALAGAEAFVALHLDLVVSSWITTDAIVWVVLAAWAAWLVVESRLGSGSDAGVVRRAVVAGTLLALCGAHVLHHRPWTPSGLGAFAGASALLGLTPCANGRAGREGEWTVARLLLLLPTWLVLFAAAGREPVPAASFATAWPWTLGALGALATAWCLRRGDGRAFRLPERAERWRLVHRTLVVVQQEGRALAGWAALGVGGLSVVLALSASGSPTPARTWLALAVLQGWAAFEVWKGFADRAPARTVLAAQGLVFCASACLRAWFVREHPMRWSPEHDVWALVAASLLVAGAEPRWRGRGRAFERALFPATLVLPLFTLLVVVRHALGIDLLLVVLGLQAVLWSWLGRGDERTPYRAAATFGFAAFTIVTFYAKLELRVLHAYVLPVGLALLVLIQLSRDAMSRRVRNTLRAAIHFAMLGTTAWSALSDPRYPVAFHVTLLLLAVLSMAAGALVRVRLFLTLGFAGLLVALGSILQRVLGTLDRGARLTSIGFLVLLLGVALVLATVYYKTHREAMNERLARWRTRLGTWE